MKKLQLEFHNEFSRATDSFKAGKGTILMTPPIDKDYWVFRIKLMHDQSIIAFPKFTTMGIGFALETDWNTNLPYSCDALTIYKHIRVNKLHKNIRKADCIRAIDILIKACTYYKEHEAPQNIVSEDLGIMFEHVNKLKNISKS